MSKKGVSFEDEINDMVDGIYNKYVKPEVREFIEKSGKDGTAKGFKELIRRYF